MLTLSQLKSIMPRLPAEKVAECLPQLNAAMWEFEIAVRECTDAACRHGDEPEHPTPARMAAFLAQLAHESGDLRWWEESPHTLTPFKKCDLCATLLNTAMATGGEFPGHAAGVQYEGRRDLGNTEPGDGVRFKGRGPLRLFGRALYRAASEALFPGVPQTRAGDGPWQTVLEAHPERLLEPAIGFRTSAWFWATRTGRPTANEVADLAAESMVPLGNDIARDYFDAITRAINGLDGADERWAYYLRAREVLGLGSA